MNRITVLHSHSALERELQFPKHIVLVDATYSNLFLKDTIEPFVYKGKHYVKVPILSFVHNGGIFKNLSE